MQLSERLASLGVMGPNSGALKPLEHRSITVSRGLRRAIFKTPQTSQHYGIEGFKEGPQFGPHYAERRKSGHIGFLFLKRMKNQFSDLSKF